jgi:hypothetical protein
VSWGGADDEPLAGSRDCDCGGAGALFGEGALAADLAVVSWG